MTKKRSSEIFAVPKTVIQKSWSAKKISVPPKLGARSPPLWLYIAKDFLLCALNAIFSISLFLLYITLNQYRPISGSTENILIVLKIVKNLISSLLIWWKNFIFGKYTTWTSFW